MYYTVYKITNQINNKIYIGAHQSKTTLDDYMGSGKHIKLAVKKYGIENFIKEILHTFDNSDDMFNMETVLVNANFLLREDVYNINLGGRRGFSLKNASMGGKTSQENIRRLPTVEREKIYTKWADNIHKGQRRKLSENNGKLWFTPTKSFLGKHHTNEAKQKIGAANKKLIGPLNMQYGTMWIYNQQLKDCKKIQPQDIDIWRNKGYVEGRKMNWNQPTIPTCNGCGNEICIDANICKRGQLIKSLVELFGFNGDVIGTQNIYDEFHRIRSNLYDMHHNQDISKLQIAKNVNASHQRINNIFKSLKIPSRTISEMNKAFHARKNVGVAE